MISPEIIREFFEYDPFTGVLTLLPRDKRWFRNEHFQKIFNTRFGNTEVSYQRKGYLYVSVFKKSYAAHRLIWYYMTGSWPSKQIDHIDGNTLNNRWENLRHVDYEQNTKNKRLDKRNSSGISGVYKTPSNTWMVYAGKRYLGTYKSFEEAVAIRKQTEVEFNYHKNHGRR